MECPRCTNDPCNCGEPLDRSVPYIRSTYRELPKGITKEEFGVALYETIKIIGGILALNQHYQTAVWKEDPDAKADYQARRLRQVDRLQSQMAALSDSDAAQVALKYPWVLHV